MNKERATKRMLNVNNIEIYLQPYVMSINVYTIIFLPISGIFLSYILIFI